MTNRDTFTPAPVGKFMFEELDQRWHHIKHGEAQFTEPRLPMVKLYGEETVRKLLEERDADKKRISELEESHKKLRETIAAIHNTIRADGAYTPLAAIMRGAKRAYDESAAVAGIKLEVGE